MVRGPACFPVSKVTADPTAHPMTQYFTATTCFLATFLVAGTLSAQGQDETLLRGGVGSVGWYLAPVVKLTEISDRGEVMGGLRGGLLFSRRFGVGLAAYAGGRLAEPLWSFRSFRPSEISGDGRSDHDETALRYGGLELEYIWQPSKLVHTTVTTLLGGGSMPSYAYSTATVPEGPGPLPWGQVRRERFFVAESSANVEVNLARYVRLGAGLGYRFTAGGEPYSDLPSQARGATGSFTIRFGKL